VAAPRQVFISYDPDDRVHAQELAGRLRQAGFDPLLGTDLLAGEVALLDTPLDGHGSVHEAG